MIITIKDADKDLDEMAKAVGSLVKDNMLTIPPDVGSGTLRRCCFSPSMKMIVIQCTFREELVFKRAAMKTEKGLISLGFRNIIQENSRENNHSLLSFVPSVYVSSTDFDMDFIFPADTRLNFVVIIINISLLKEMLHLESRVIPQFQPIFSINQPFHFEEVMSAEIQNIAAQLETTKIPTALYFFHQKLKAEELIYFFFAALLKRQAVYTYPVNREDIETLYKIRDCIIEDISKIPNLPELAKYACMSESKMKRLFKQIFGKSIYNYYQYFRMTEAAYMIKEKKISVSQTGYQVGFTSLSHFSKIFEQHIGLKPKKYSMDM